MGDKEEVLGEEEKEVRETPRGEVTVGEPLEVGIERLEEDGRGSGVGGGWNDAGVGADEVCA